MVRARGLAPDETLLVRTHTHWRALVGPVLWFILLSALVGAGTALTQRWLPAGLGEVVAWTWAAIMLATMLWLVLLPVLRWGTTVYVITDRRVISRRGLLSRTGHDLPLRRVNDVAYRRSLLDRVLGCGTVVLLTGAEAPVVLRDVPHVADVHLLLNEVLYDLDDTPHSVGWERGYLPSPDDEPTL